MAIDLYAERLNMLNLTNKTLNICDNHESNQYRKLLEARDSSLLWFVENSKDVKSQISEDGNSVIITIGQEENTYKTENKNILNKIKQQIKQKKDEKQSVYIPTTEEIENSIEIRTMLQAEAKENLVETLDFYNTKYQQQKDKQSFVYSEYKIGIYKNSQLIENVKLYLFPLKMYENKLNPECIPVLEKGGYLKQRQPLFDFSLDYDNSKIKTAFYNGVLYGGIVPNENSEFSYKIEEEKFYAPTNKTNIGFGHICFPYNNQIMHIFPYTRENNESGESSCLTIIENGHKLHEVKEDGGRLLMKTQQEIKQIVVYWQDDTLVSAIVSA